MRARLWHFLAMCGFLAFIPGHLVMVALHGWNNFVSMLVGWKKDPEYSAAGKPLEIRPSRRFTKGVSP